jgi:AcrR family transcriptional regulator
MDVKPRKSPRQARAKATVDAIVEATSQVLQKEGYDNFTTARAAERAGVSVGSLYQYFPNKAALASAVIDRCSESFIGAFQRALAGRQPAMLADCIDAMVEVTLVSHHMAPELHRIVRELAPRLGVADRSEMVSHAAAKMIESVLRKHTDEIAPEIDVPTAAAIIETTLQALSHRAAAARPSEVTNDMLAKEAARMITRYLAAR